MSDRANRILLLVLGLALAGAGAAGLAAGLHWIEVDAPGTLYARLFGAAEGRWTVAVAGTAAALPLVGLGAWLASAELRPPRHPGMRPLLLGGGRRGWTRVEPRALERALLADLERSPAVEAGRARLLTGRGPTDAGPTVELDLRVFTEEATLERLSRDVDGACRRLGRAVGFPGPARARARVRLTPGAPQRRRRLG